MGLDSIERALQEPALRAIAGFPEGLQEIAGTG
jgi:hypothetical protein